MLRPTRSLASLPAGLLLIASVALADDWTSVGFDAQRSSWVRFDAKTSPSSVRGPDFRFLWRIEVPNTARSGNALTAPALLDFLISHRGFRSLAFVGGSSGGVYAMDTDLARMEWERHFLPGPSASSPDCPGGMTANLTRPTAAAMPSSLGFPGRGRRSPARSGVGQPGEGAVTLAEVARPPTQAASRPASTRTRPPAQRALRGVTLVYALSADGMLRLLGERDLIREVGRKDAPGRPIQYGTSGEFLRIFGITSIADLPKLAEADRAKFKLPDG